MTPPSSNDASGSVFVAKRCKGGHKPIYHTDPECYILKQATRPREVPLGHPLTDSRRPCKHCEGTSAPRDVPQGPSLSAKLHALNPEDLNLTPAGDRP